MKAKDNPFKTEEILKIRYILNNISWKELLDKLELLNYRGEITGPEGSGKTTLLEDTGEKLSKLGFNIKFIGLNREKKSIETYMLYNLSSKDIILLDGAEQLGTFAWQRFKWKTASAGGLIITGHKKGMLPSLYECSTSPELLQEIVKKLLGHDGEHFRDINYRLYDKYYGNIRDVLRELYDMFSEK